MILAKIEDILKAKNLSLSKTAIVNLLYTYGHISQKLNNALKPYDISLQQFNVLRILRGQNKNPMSLEMVQERMINKMSNTTRLIDKLVKKEYVEKSKNKTNRRKVNIVITQKGLELLSQVDILIDNRESSILQSLSQDETKEFIRLLGKIHG
ncbi:MarR family winged helix-turn-helix transcriptional regulator [Snuella sedimenti]|uniref:MarR family transcriptional regulator n=1 Tax=Snuella sedimenti TaxID=2798802 RepID=A0A8J7J1Q4_9FLAO|nr:MarR family transcriptional regulator [Snuella sedimenti]MBJ6368092.1 MarR family transcriptional regulator [Snuella sedimenti]